MPTAHLPSSLTVADAVAASAKHSEWRPFRVEWPLQIGPDTQLDAGSHLTLDQVELLGYPAIEHLLANGTLSFVDAPAAAPSAPPPEKPPAPAPTETPPPPQQRKSPSAPRAR